MKVASLYNNLSEPAKRNYAHMTPAEVTIS